MRLKSIASFLSIGWETDEMPKKRHAVALVLQTWYISSGWFWQSPHLIHSSSHSLICSFSFPHAPSACHSFISLIVSSFVSPPLSKIFLFRSSYSGINSSQQQTGSISLYLALVLFSSLSLSFIPALFMDQYQACPKTLEGN